MTFNCEKWVRDTTIHRQHVFLHSFPGKYVRSFFRSQVAVVVRSLTTNSSFVVSRRHCKYTILGSGLWAVGCWLVLHYYPLITPSEFLFILFQVLPPLTTKTCVWRPIFQVGHLVRRGAESWANREFTFCTRPGGRQGSKLLVKIFVVEGITKNKINKSWWMDERLIEMRSESPCGYS